MKQYEILDTHKVNNFLDEWKANYKFIETGQLRRAKMHAARLIDADNDMGNDIPSTLKELLEACLVLETTDSKILAAYFKTTPANIRSEFQRIRTILEGGRRNSKNFC
ncbi:MAG: hypothetical protein IPP22_04290 [Nitrosomonas sp.]|nr:hypothetical protein [Nitrosomonas sp.]